MRGVARTLRCAKLRMRREHPVLPLASAHLLQLVEGRAAARLLRGQGGEAAPQRRSIRCTPVQHSAAWWAACWCCARCLRGGFGVVLPAEASGARHARRRAWPGRSQRARSMSQPARRERRASWHIVCMLPSILRGRRRSISRLSIKTGGLCDAVYAIVFWLRFLFCLVLFCFFFCEATEGGAGGR